MCILCYCNHVITLRLTCIIVLITIIFQILASDVTVDASIPYKQLGYCPQHDALYNDISLIEHLDLYAALRGYNKRMRHAIIN